MAESTVITIGLQIQTSRLAATAEDDRQQFFYFVRDLPADDLRRFFPPLREYLQPGVPDRCFRSLALRLAGCDGLRKAITDGLAMEFVGETEVAGQRAVPILSDTFVGIITRKKETAISALAR